MAPDGTPRTVNAVEITCDIISALRDLNGGGVTEIADHIGVSKATTYSHLATLRQQEFVVKEDGQYDLSLRYLDLGEYAKDRVGIYDIVTSEIDDLANDTGELAQFATEEYGKLIYLYKSASDSAVITASRIGKRQHLHATALGKAILATFPDEHVDDIIDRHGLPKKTPNTITDRGELFAELQATNERGYAIDDEEVIEGLRCIAAPITDSDGGVLGAVSVSGPSRRMDGERINEELPDDVTGVANVIEINAKFS